MAVEIKNIEYSLPEKRITNEELKETHPEWDFSKIEQKSGVFQRFIVKSEETALDLAEKACNQLFINSEIDKNNINCIIFCTQSPDYIMPPNSFLLHGLLNLPNNVFTFDYNLACSGYIYGLIIANALIEMKTVKNVLLITAETYSKYINQRDRSTSILFGDAAAVSYIDHSESAESRIIDILFASSGKDYKLFYIPAGGQRLPRSEQTSVEYEDYSGNFRSQENIFMNGFGVWRFISKTVPIQINEILHKNSLSVNDIDLFVFHQASKMTIDSLIKNLSLPREKVYLNLDRIGNCVSASIPIALKDAETSGRLKKGI